MLKEKKEMEDTRNKTVADFVIQNINTAPIFNKYGIDFCYSGEVSIEKACSKCGVDYHQLENELNDLQNKTTFLNDFNKWGLDFLMIFIVHIHHRYVKKNIPLLKNYADKAAKSQSKEYKELIEINKLVLQLSKGLTIHMIKEETIVFPFIKKLFKADKENTSILFSNLNPMNNPIVMMEEYHDEAGELFKRISKLTNTYKAPENASKPFQKLCKKLEEFENNLNKHVHLENNILFPKAKKLKLKVLEY